MGAQKQFRNSSTHRFTVLHDIGREPAPDSSAIEHKNLDEFKQLTLASLRLARSALFYFVDFIVFSEDHRENEPSGFLASFEVPDHDYIRGRKE